ncbi:putative hydro-lyase [Chelativorans sp. Marseille-P2723]|uniref:putative hydro-lyase n=1 Tax=Chelativorans sp. Marseille-P2723 TaxID=2709133 RepID=UPI001570B9E2|nr:putative hydro-lyase [Chelativorans sp. Marseille-P2723]
MIADSKTSISMRQQAMLNSPYDGRIAVRRGEWTGVTTNMAPGYVQGNLAILPREYAYDFLLFCYRNPKPCPLIAVSDVGNPKLENLGKDIDIRTDLPCYRVYRDGVLEEEVTDITHLWRDDFVTFVIGCSLSFEKAILDSGIRMRHIERGTDCPMYVTNLSTNPAGPFRGEMVVSMRPFSPQDAVRVTQITSRFPTVHGAPVHIGYPEMIGVRIEEQDFGVAADIQQGEVPVFWACGVTPQNVIRYAKPSICITHKPGHMLVTDQLSGSQSML